MNKNLNEEINKIYSIDSEYINSLYKRITSTIVDEKISAEIEITNLLSPIIPAFNYNYYNPPWLSDCNFDDNIWYIERNLNAKKIDFGKIYLNDQIRLIDSPLLEIFKLWLSVSCSPKFNNGIFIKRNSLLQILNMNLAIIDSIIINSKKINLVERGINALDSSFFKDIVINIAKSGLEEGVYDFRNQVKEYLLKSIKDIDLDDVIDFEKKYPYLHFTSTNYLNLSKIELRKSKFFLYKKNAYRVKNSLKTSVNNSTFDILFKNTLVQKYLHFNIIDELSLSPPSSGRKYSSVPTKSYDNINLTKNRIFHIVRIIESINLAFNIAKVKHSHIKIDFSSIFHHVEEIPSSRVTSLPATVIFKAFQDAYIYVYKYMDGILDSFLKIILNVDKFRSNSKPTLKLYKEKILLNYMHKSLKELDIKTWSTTEFLNKDINNKEIGIVQAYQILMGSISILIGIVMARRQSEITTLSTLHVLTPTNIDPSKFPSTEFYLKVKIAKSGSGGAFDLREEIDLPIPLSIAKIIYKLQEFNLKLIRYFPKYKENPTLITTLNPVDISFSYTNQTTHNHYLDYFCDFFETEIILNNGIHQRYYIRQHQLRRFFAMLFFWANSFDGIDSLRKFLGHTKMEHIYNYITESTPGAVLAGVKAQYISEHIGLTKENTAYIQNIEALEPILKKYFSVGYFDFLSCQEISENYVNAISKKELEQSLCTLLSNSIIDIKPQFFKSTTKSGSHSFKLILIVNDNENFI